LACGSSRRQLTGRRGRVKAEQALRRAD
jgi:hypothetical protein